MKRPKAVVSGDGDKDLDGKFSYVFFEYLLES